jgi:hypothetical protein
MEYKNPQTVTEISTAVVNRVQQLLEKYPNTEETAFNIQSLTFNNLQFYLNMYDDILYVNFLIKKPIKYIKPETIGLPQTVSGFEHGKLNKFIWDLNEITSQFTTTEITTEIMTRERYDPKTQQALYTTRVTIKS